MATLLTGSDLVTAAKNIRAELREAFPNTKFSVRSSRFSGGNAIDIDWVDGPTTEPVNQLVGKYKAGEFDGMTDCYDYKRSNERGFNDSHGSAKYVHTRRDYSDAAVAGAIASLVVRYGTENAPTVDDYRQGRVWNRKTSGGCDWAEILNRELSRTTF